MSISAFLLRNIPQLRDFLSMVPTFKGVSKKDRDFPGGPVLKNLSCNAGDTGSILVGELRSHVPQSNSAHGPQLESPSAATKDPA